LDIQRAPKAKRGKYVIGAAVLAVIVFTTIALARLPHAAPTVERSTLWIDTVQRGTMLRQVRAPGTLVPEQIQLVSALTAGRIERLPVRAGTVLAADQVLLELSNPDVQLQALDAARQLTAAEAAEVNLRTNLETSRLTQAGVLATVRTQYQEAKRTAMMNDTLAASRLVTKMEQARASDQAHELEERVGIERQRLALLEGALGRQVALQHAEVERMRAIAKFQEERVASMVVRPGAAGVLQDMPLELGQWVTPGQVLARVAQPGHLKAMLRVPETQAKDIAIGQPVSVDTRNGTAGVVQGHVMRVDPAVQNGTVLVEVALDGALPPGARPDLSVDGTVEIERLPDVVHVARPAYGAGEGTVSLFRLTPAGTEATRVQVKLGRSSVNAVEVLGGLNPGDRIIISDMSAWETAERVRVK
jgi:multidrug efflux pump subunit AcrA (membrane-fusion protein)